MPTSSIPPCKCATRPAPARLLDAIAPDGMGAAAAVCVHCPDCGEAIELQWRSGSYVYGYSYAAGSSHFERMGTVRVRGLKLQPAEPDDLEVRLGDRVWRFGIRTSARWRERLDGNEWACGRTVGEIDLAQWCVVLIGVRRQDTLLDLTPDLRFEHGDMVTLEGPRPALYWAARTLREGLRRVPGQAAL